LKNIDLPPQLKTGFLVVALALASALASLGCVNRGMVAPAPDGETGVGGHGGGSGGAMVDASRDAPDGGGGGGIDGGGGSGGDSCDVDGGADGGDAGAVVDAGGPSVCTAMFNFESPAGCGLYGATLGNNVDNPPQTAGFTNLRHSALARCGRGSMAVDVDFDTAARTGGEIIVTISPSGTASFTGKTLSLSMMGSADGGNSRFYVYLIANGTFQPVLMAPITTTWQSFSVSLPVPDAGAASTENVMSISLEAFGRGANYKGTIYIDELDVRDTAPDGGANDGGPSDARDAAPGDARDAPSGN
jgi:hypothetical protein